MGCVHTDSLIEKWVNYAFDEENNHSVVEKFVFIWFAFNGYYGRYLTKYNKEKDKVIVFSEISAIKYSLRIRAKECTSKIKIFSELNKMECFNLFKNIDIKKMHPRYNSNSDDSTNNNTTDNITDTIDNNDNYNFDPNNPRECLNSYLDKLYRVRCNLFHGYKHTYEEKDFKILALATECLCWILYYFDNGELKSVLEYYQTEWEGSAVKEIANYKER